jgi:hypothetical protein
MLIEKYGVIAFLDALGARSFTTEQNEAFLNFGENLVDNLFADRWKTPKPEKPSQVEFLTACDDKPLTKQIGDSIVIVWDLGLENADAEEKERVLIRKLPGVINRLVPSIRIGLDNENHWLLRGALSAGHYCISNERDNIILGKAFVDAYEWHDQVQWVGLVVTPECGFKLNNSAIAIKGSDTHGLNKYGYAFWHWNKCPLRDGKKIFLWSVSWPWAYYQDGEPGRRCFFESLSKAAVTFEGAEKLIRTQEFFNDFWYEFEDERHVIRSWQQSC